MCKYKSNLSFSESTESSIYYLVVQHGQLCLSIRSLLKACLGNKKSIRFLAIILHGIILPHGPKALNLAKMTLYYYRLSKAFAKIVKKEKLEIVALL